MDGARQKFLDQALDGYRAGARAWSRDALLCGLVLLFAGGFVVAPFVGGSGERRALEAERARTQQEQGRVVAGARAVDGLLGSLAEARQAAAATAERLAAELAGRLRRFAGLAQSLQPGAPPPGLVPPDPGALPAAEPGFPGAMVQQVAPPPAEANFPGAMIAQQAAPRPGPQLPLLVEPAAVLEGEFGLAPDDLEQFRRAFEAGPDTAAWARASATSERLFTAEIERTYGLLEAAVEGRLSALRSALAEGLGDLAAASPGLGAGLPTVEQLLPPAAVVRLPGEDQLFRSVIGKGEAFNRVGLYQVNLNLDAAGAPLHAVAGQLAEADARLEAQRARLAASQAGIERQLQELDRRLEAIRGELGGLGAPLQWLAIDTASFVRLYPTLLALGALWLVLRYRRLDDLRARLEAGYRDLGIDERDVRLALYVPDAALGRLQELPGGTGGARRFLRPALGVGLALGLALVTIWLQRAGEPASLVWAALPLALGLAACGLILAERRQPAGGLT